MDAQMDAVTAWADAQLAAQGVGRTGEIELQRARPWSTIWRMPTEVGTAWLKACGSGGRYEAGLTALLAQVAAEWTLQPLAVDIERGWLLLPDGGSDLQSALRGSGPEVVVERWTALLTEYAGLQRRMVDLVAHLRAVEVPELSADSASERFGRLVEEHTGGALRERLLDRVDGLGPVWDRLRRSAVPVSLQHDDLHAAAALCGEDGLGAPAFFDWGDAVISHPMASLLVARRVLAMTLEVAETDRSVEEVTDAYLRCWTDLAPIADLRTELDDVWQLGRLGRAWSWARALADAGPEERAPWEEPVAAWLEQML